MRPDIPYDFRSLEPSMSRETLSLHFALREHGYFDALSATLRDTAIGRRGAPLLVLDLWERAYYLDHQNRRTAYVEMFLDELVDWDFANRNLSEQSGASTRPPSPMEKSDVAREPPFRP